MDADAIQTVIDNVAQTPQEMASEIGSAKSHKLPELLEWKKAATADAAAANNARRGIRFTKLILRGNT